MDVKIIVLLVLVAVVASDSSFEWDKFRRHYHKHYTSAVEEAERKQIFIENVNQMRVYQQAHPKATFTMSINSLTDRRIQELLHGPKVHFEPRLTSVKSSVKATTFPDELDWRSKGVVSPVHNQGIVGDVVGIVSTEVIETFNAIRTKELVEGSTARVDDCCPQPLDPFDCIQNMSGICRKTDYPTALGTCEPNKCKPFATFDTINRINEGDENTMLMWIQDSTLYAEVDASEFATYDKGIYDHAECAQTELNHVLQIVGYGIEGGVPFWLGKNSWGENWGEQGYIRLVRGKNMCGIANIVVQVADTMTTYVPTFATTYETTDETTYATTHHPPATTPNSATRLYATCQVLFMFFFVFLCFEPAQ